VHRLKEFLDRRKGVMRLVQVIVASNGLAFLILTTTRYLHWWRAPWPDAANRALFWLLTATSLFGLLFTGGLAALFALYGRSANKKPPLRNVLRLFGTLIEYALFALWAWAELRGVRPRFYGGLAFWYFIAYQETMVAVTVRQNLREARERRQSVKRPSDSRSVPSPRPARHLWLRIKIAMWRFWWRAFRKKRRFPLDDSLMQAVLTGNINNVEVFIKRGANANAFLVSMPLLAFAVGKGQVETARLLLAAGANVNARSALTGVVALSCAVIGNNLELASLLLAHGAEVNAKNYKGLTALMLAAELGNIPLVQMLLEHGANVSARSKRGSTALQFAQRKGHSAIVDLLESGSPRIGG